MSRAHRRRLSGSRGMPGSYDQYRVRVLRTFTRRRDGVVRQAVEIGTNPKRRVIWDRP